FSHFSFFFGASDVCLLRALWTAGLTTRHMSVEAWRDALQRRPYASASEHLMVGSLTWMAAVVSEVSSTAARHSFNHNFVQRHEFQMIYMVMISNISETFIICITPCTASQLMQAHRLHVERTSWVWVLRNTAEYVGNGTLKDRNDAPRPIRLPLTPLQRHPRPFTVSFSYATEVLDRLAQGVLKGVLLMEQEHLSSPPPSSRLVHVGGMRVRRDWFWELASVGLYRDNHLTLINPLWPARPHDFHGGNIYIAFSQKAATIEANSTSLADAQGYLADTLKIVMGALNATGVLRLTTGAGSRDDTGAWNGVIGVIVRDEADIGAVDFMPNHQRLEVVDFSVSIGQDPVIIFSSAPYFIIQPFLLFQIFSVEPLLSALIQTSTKLSTFTGQSGMPPGASARLLASFLMLVSLCLCSVYSGSITAFLVIPFRSKPINSVQEMLDSDVIPCARSKTNTVANIINNPSGALYAVRHRVKIMAGEEFDTQAYMDQVSQGTFALIDVLSAALGRANAFTRRGARCWYHTSRESIQVNLDAIALKRNSRFTWQVNNVLMSLQYFGFIQNVKRTYYKPLCVTERKDSGPSSLKLVQVCGGEWGSFFFLSFFFCFRKVAHDLWAYDVKKKLYYLLKRVYISFPEVQGAFFVLVAGLGLSIAVLTTEALFSRRF
ncbi:uncharacterized protein LOC127004290, partial [Eriocheir sinensis]|uniref:uncharacterized protein LOC127004290 n=1 Tax=Eriocheir sinensis TaxID=95602 RepID=UPI0021C79CB4